MKTLLHLIYIVLAFIALAMIIVSFGDEELNTAMLLIGSGLFLIAVSEGLKIEKEWADNDKE